jgi:hypothetical protein
VSAGERDAEPAGEEYAAGEHDVEDLESCEEEEGGELSYFSCSLSLLYSASSNCSLDGFVATIPCRRWSLAGVA